MPNPPVSQFKRLQEEAEALLNDSTVPRNTGNAEHPVRRFLHFWILVGRSFVQNRCPVRASALAYSSLLALVPMLALVLSITTSILKSSQGEQLVNEMIDQIVESMLPSTRGPIGPPAPGTVLPATTAPLRQASAEIDSAKQKIQEFIRNTQSTTIGVTGALALVFLAITMLARIEATLNDIWGITQGRTWYTRIMVYWATVSLGPLILVAALALTSASQFQSGQKLLVATPILGALLPKVLPAVVLSLLFGLLYALMPNTRVRWKAALVGGLVAGTLWHLNNLFSVKFISRITSNNAIYGSLGLVPVFMVGLYLGWIILLFGAQVSYAYQNRVAYLQDRQAEGTNQRGREFVGLRLVTLIALRFANSQPGLTTTQLANELAVPGRLVRRLLEALIQHGLVVEATSVKETVILPARPLPQISCEDVLTALRTVGGYEPETRDEPTRQHVRRTFDRIRAAEFNTANTITLQDLVESVRAPNRSA
jgi:membrane protein